MGLAVSFSCLPEGIPDNLEIRVILSEIISKIHIN